jgi:hypothetical protein
MGLVLMERTPVDNPVLLACAGTNDAFSSNNGSRSAT